MNPVAFKFGTSADRIMAKICGAELLISENQTCVGCEKSFYGKNPEPIDCIVNAGCCPISREADFILTDTACGKQMRQTAVEKMLEHCKASGKLCKIDNDFRVWCKHPVWDTKECWDMYQSFVARNAGVQFANVKVVSL